MSGRAIRLSFAVATVLVFLLLWAAVAAHPWTSAAKHTAVDPRLTALADKQRRLQHEAAQVKRLLDRRWALYGHKLTRREQQIALARRRHRTELAVARAARARIAAVLAARAEAAAQAAPRASLVSVVATVAPTTRDCDRRDPNGSRFPGTGAPAPSARGDRRHDHAGDDHQEQLAQVTATTPLQAAPPRAPLASRLQRHTFQSMAVRIECLLESDGPATAAFAEVEREFDRLEQVFSRFRPDSELSQLNGAGSWAGCSTDLFDVVVLALDARQRTGGRFDPTVLEALVACGYDRTFVDLPPDGPAPLPRPCAGRVEVDRATRTIRLDGRTGLDLGGIVKGYAAERACRLLGAAGPCLVNAGGDIAIAGAPGDGAWPIAVDTEGAPLTLGLSQGGVATSGRDFRRWLRGGREQHHLIDPRTGVPSASDLLSVTVVAPSAVEAEIQTKALFLAGERGAVDEANAAGLPCVLRARDGRVIRAGGLS